MKIVVNTRFLLKNKLEGIGRFTNEIFSRICKNHPEDQFIFLFDRKPDMSFLYADNVIPVILRPQSRHPFLWYIWFEHSVANFLNAEKPDLFVSPDGYNVLNTNVKSLIVIHDINFEHFPDILPCLTSKYYRFFTPKFAKKANKIITVSKFSKEDIYNTYGIDKNKIEIVYNAPAKVFKPLNTDDILKIKQIYSENNDFYVYIGSLHPRKNVHLIIKAFDIYKRTYKTTDKLLIIGNKMFKTTDIEKAYDQSVYKNDIKFTGYLSDKQIAKILASSKALIFVPKFEGFGLPVVEAMKCGIPVICSSTSSLPEICGNAGLSVKNINAETIAEAMVKINDKILRYNLINNGFENIKQFDWDKSSEKFYEIMKKIIM